MLTFSQFFEHQALLEVTNFTPTSTIFAFRDTHNTPGKIAVKKLQEEFLRGYSKGGIWIGVVGSSNGLADHITEANRCGYPLDRVLFVEVNSLPYYAIVNRWLLDNYSKTPQILHGMITTLGVVDQASGTNLLTAVDKGPIQGNIQSEITHIDLDITSNLPYYVNDYVDIISQYFENYPKLSSIVVVNSSARGSNEHTIKNTQDISSKLSEIIHQIDNSISINPVDDNYDLSLLRKILNIVSIWKFNKGVCRLRGTDFYYRQLVSSLSKRGFDCVVAPYVGVGKMVSVTVAKNTGGPERAYVDMSLVGVYKQYSGENVVVSKLTDAFKSRDKALQFFNQLEKVL